MRSENISTLIYVECDKMYRSKACVQEFSYFVSGLDIQLEKFEKDSPVSKKMVAGGEIQRIRYGFFQQLIRTNGLEVKVGCSESADMGSIPLQPECLGHLAWH